MGAQRQTLPHHSVQSSLVFTYVIPYKISCQVLLRALRSTDYKFSHKHSGNQTVKVAKIKQKEKQIIDHADLLAS